MFQIYIQKADKFPEATVSKRRSVQGCVSREFGDVTASVHTFNGGSTHTNGERFTWE